MDRRTKQRFDVQLLSRLGTGAIRSTAREGITENISRDGILMRWLEAVALHEVGSSLTVELSQPESEDSGPRLIRRRTSVVQIKRGADGHREVTPGINRLRFAPAPSPASAPEFDVESMAPITKRVS